MSESKTMKQLHSIREKNHERMKHLPAREWSREEHRAFISMRGGLSALPFYVVRIVRHQAVTGCSIITLSKD